MIIKNIRGLMLMEKVYLICYSTEEGTFISHIAFKTEDLAWKEIKSMGADGEDMYVIDVPFISK